MVDGLVLSNDTLHSNAKSPLPIVWKQAFIDFVTISGLSLMLLHGANLCVQA